MTKNTVNMVKDIDHIKELSTQEYFVYCTAVLLLFGTVLVLLFAPLTIKMAPLCFSV